MNAFAGLACDDPPESAQVLRQGLPDEINLLVFPVLVGQGKRLFAGHGGAAGLRLARSQAFPPACCT
jgi:dihydrofolate reductase